MKVGDKTAFGRVVKNVPKHWEQLEMFHRQTDQFGNEYWTRFYYVERCPHRGIKQGIAADDGTMRAFAKLWVDLAIAGKLPPEEEGDE